MTVRYHVSVLGTLWWPIGALAATTLHYQRGRGPLSDDRMDEPELPLAAPKLPVPSTQEIEIIEDRLAGLDTGDFSSVVDYQIEGPGGVLRPWAREESELEFSDCFPEID